MSAPDKIEPDAWETREADRNPGHSRLARFQRPGLRNLRSFVKMLGALDEFSMKSPLHRGRADPARAEPGPLDAIGSDMKTRGWTLPAIVAAIAAGSIAANTDFHEPPRYDGAGYAILGLALNRGQGYREINHPDTPPHDHFPPGYPLVLASLWNLNAPLEVSGHAFSLLCSSLGFALAAIWLRRLFPGSPTSVALLSAAMAANWVWGRMGGEIRSEPLFLLLTMSAILLADRPRAPDSIKEGVILGVALGACILTRHIGAALAIAIWIDCGLRRRWRTLWISGLTTIGLIAPWVIWVANTAIRPQAALLGRDEFGWLELIVGQTLFYARRIPDQIAGPFVEVATVFAKRPDLATAATIAAALASALIVVGWVRLIQRRRRRLAGLVPLTTLAVLLIWPFTEAGRFLAPLLPPLILGAWEGIVWLLSALRIASRRNVRVWAAGLILGASLPYPIYAIIAQRAQAQRDLQRDFDAACWFLNGGSIVPGTVMAKHPGDVHWLSGLPTVSVEDPADAAKAIYRWQVVYILTDRGRYANEEPGPGEIYVRDHPYRTSLIWGDPKTSSVLIYEVARDARP